MGDPVEHYSVRVCMTILETWYWAGSVVVGARDDMRTHHIASKETLYKNKALDSTANNMYNSCGIYNIHGLIKIEPAVVAIACLQVSIVCPVLLPCMCARDLCDSPIIATCVDAAMLAEHSITEEVCLAHWPGKLHECF